MPLHQADAGSVASQSTTPIDRASQSVKSPASIDGRGDRDLQRRFLACLSMSVTHGVNKNVSHAKTMGMSEFLIINDDQWSILLMSFFIGMIFSTLATATWFSDTRSNRIQTYLCASSIASGLVTASIGFTPYLPAEMSRHAWIWLIATRGIQGLCEGFSTVVFIQHCSSMFHTSKIGSKSIGLSSLPIISATIGAIYASAMFHFRTNKLFNWQMLYFGKGIFTIALSLVIWTTQAATASEIKLLNEETGEVKAVCRSLRHICEKSAAWHWLLVNFCLGVPLTTLLLYAPQLVQGLGFSSDMANILTVFPYVAALAIFQVQLLVDMGGGGLSCLIAIQFVGFVIYRAAVPQNSRLLQVIAYLATILMTCTLCTTTALLTKKYGSQFHSKDRQRLGFCSIALSQSTGLMTSWTFRGNGSLNNDLAIVSIAVAFLISCLQSGDLGFGETKAQNEKAREDSRARRHT